MALNTSLMDRVIELMQEDLEHHEKLLHLTKKTVKRNKHKLNAKFMREVISDYKEEYSYILDQQRGELKG